MTVLDRIWIDDAGNRAKYRWQVKWTAHVINETNGSPMPCFDTGSPCAFNARGDATMFATKLAERLETNLGHQTEVRL